MIRGLLPFALAMWLFFVGLYGIVTSRNLVHIVVCLSVVQSSTYVLLLEVGYRAGATPTISVRWRADPHGQGERRTPGRRHLRAPRCGRRAGRIRWEGETLVRRRVRDRRRRCNACAHCRAAPAGEAPPGDPL